MRELAIRARQVAIHMPASRLWVGGLLGGLLLLAGLVWLAVVPPVWQVYVGGQYMESGRDLAGLEAAVLAEAERLAGREVALVSGNNRLVYTYAALGMSVPADQVPMQFAAAVGQVSWWQRLPWSRPQLAVDLQPTWDQAVLAQAVSPWEELLFRTPVPAELKIVNQQPVITPETDGLQLDLGGLMAALQGQGHGGEVTVPVLRVRPEVTSESLGALGIKRLLTTWSTHYDPHIPRADNVEKAARAFNGLILKPGEILSYNAAVGPINETTGWKEAFVIVNGELVPGVGGGVCQVATTLYGAALRANLEIVERHQHQLAVSYIAPSQDAAIAQGWEDLKIRNTSLGHLLIQAEVGGGTVTFRLYGDLPAGQEVRIESKVLGSSPFQTKQVEDQALAPGQQVVKIQGIAGLSSEAYRYLYQDGQLVKQERLSRDHYRPTAQVVLVGPQPKPQPQPRPAPAPTPSPAPAPAPAPAPTQPETQPETQPDPQPQPEQPEPQPAQP